MKNDKLFLSPEPCCLLTNCEKLRDGSFQTRSVTAPLLSKEHSVVVLPGNLHKEPWLVGLPGMAAGTQKMREISQPALQFLWKQKVTTQGQSGALFQGSSFTIDFPVLPTILRKAPDTKQILL